MLNTNLNVLILMTVFVENVQDTVQSAVDYGKSTIDGAKGIQLNKKIHLKVLNITIRYYLEYR